MSTAAIPAPRRASGSAPTAPPIRPPGSSTYTEARRSARPRRRWCRPRTPITTSCWSARTAPHPGRRPHRRCVRPASGRSAPLYIGGAVRLTYNRMVVGDVTDEEVDRLFHALADATRRDILHRCLGTAPSVSRLADGYPMSFAAVQKHVAVLERAGLVAKE